MNKKNMLLSVDFFRDLSEPDIQVLADRAAVRRYGAGELIVAHAEKVRSFYMVLEGRVKIYRSSPEGKEQTLYIFGPGEPFCLCAAFSDEGYPASAASLTPATVFSLPGAEFERIASGHPAILFNMMQVMSRRLKGAMDLVDSLSLKEIPQRVALFLQHMPRDEQEAVQLGMTHRELAKVVGATPESLSRALKKMNGAGLLKVVSGTIHIQDEPGLKLLAEGESL
jgi:CRP/FNR family transcriptional regulator